MGEHTTCRCCKAGVPFDRPRVCPECHHVFRGNGWDGIDAHWRAKHERVVPYEEFWKSLCEAMGMFPAVVNAPENDMPECIRI